MEVKDKYEQATQLGKKMEETLPRAISARYEPKNGRIEVNLSSGLNLSFSPRDAQGLESAEPAQLEEILISPSGFGIHFPRLDADLYVPALLGGFFGSKKWMASRLGQLGGRAKSRAKRRASRANGRLGGRPNSR